MYGRLSETYDAAESVPTQLDRGTDHAKRRGWTVMATFKDDGYSAFKEVTRDGFGELIAAIEGGRVDVVIVGACARSAWSTTANEYAASASRAGNTANSRRSPGRSPQRRRSASPRPPDGNRPEPPGSM